MTTGRACSLMIGLIGILGLNGCGLSAPEIREAWDGKDGTIQIEYGIKKRVYCDLRDGVQVANRKNQYFIKDSRGKEQKVQFIPDDWGVQVSLSLQVDETSALNPGLVVTKLRENAITRFSSGAAPIATGQSFSLGLGGTLSSTATRTDKFDFYYPIDFLMVEATDTDPCAKKNDQFLKNGVTPSTSSPLILSDLGIQKWISDSMYTNSLLPSQNPGSSAKTPDTVTLELKFVVVTSGNVTPTWRLVPVSFNSGGSPLFSTGRTRTHGLIITIGPKKNETSQTHFASQIGQSISNANLSSLQRP